MILNLKALNGSASENHISGFLMSHQVMRERGMKFIVIVKDRDFITQFFYVQTFFLLIVFR